MRRTQKVRTVGLHANMKIKPRDVVEVDDDSIIVSGGGSECNNIG